jgi:hypothetical protein
MSLGSQILPGKHDRRNTRLRCDGCIHRAMNCGVRLVTRIMAMEAAQNQAIAITNQRPLHSQLAQATMLQDC